MSESKDYSSRKMVEQELKRCKLTLDVILEGTKEDIVELCEENNFSKTVKIFLMKAFKESKQKQKEKNPKKSKVDVKKTSKLKEDKVIKTTKEEKKVKTTEKDEPNKKPIKKLLLMKSMLVIRINQKK